MLPSVCFSAVHLWVLIYHYHLTSLKTGADSGVKIIWCQSPREIRAICASAQFQFTNGQVLINVEAENKKRHLNNMPLFIHGLV